MTEVVRIDIGEVPFLADLHFDSDGEPIYALMITGKDPFRTLLARNAILSFLAQNYANRFLVIVNDGEYCFDLVGVPAERVLQASLTHREVLGALRNRAIQCVPAHGLWIQWDDDDWHHPSLMAEQYQFLTGNQAEVCLLQHQIKYAVATNAGWADFCSGGFAGTLMSRPLGGLRYPETPRGEDSAFCHAIKSTRHWIAWNNPPHYYLRFIHGRNTWPDSHFHLASRPPHHWVMRQPAAQYLKSVLPLYAGLHSDNAIAER